MHQLNFLKITKQRLPLRCEKFLKGHMPLNPQFLRSLCIAQRISCTVKVGFKVAMIKYVLDFREAFYHGFHQPNTAISEAIT